MYKSHIPQIFRESNNYQLQLQDDLSISKFDCYDPESQLKEISKVYDKNEESEKVQLSTQYQIFENEKEGIKNQNQCQNLVYPNPLEQIRIPFDKIQFILQPIQNEGILQCQIRKIRMQSSKQNTKYELTIFDLPILIAEINDLKQKRKIIIKQSGLNYFAGKLKWDKYGQNFIFWDNKISPKKCSTVSMQRLCIGGANYQKTGMKKPHKIRVYLPELNSDNQMFEYRLEKYKYFQSKPKHFQEFQNRVAEYSKEAKTFVLPFYNRALIASSKNLQLCQSDNNKVFFLLGKIEKGLYNLDFQWPILPLQAFQIAMSCFVTRATD
ncbi:unnamed protein product [Paramecium primaurelia]|uniref:Tubby C-terminal domain-containing protein n=1 Tax=Paramecium primaurelia TaxID=5886 RepID=A0A8S1L0X9_PARPR|nr:unnamed protein product [Paramecium primaurelia]